jgi:hypothetical protein
MSGNETNHNDWVENLTNDISEFLSSNKSIKFNTHRNRKAIISKINSMIKESIATNTGQINKEGFVTKTESAITKIRPDAEPSYRPTVMTEELSSKGDESLERTMSKNKNGTRVW